MSFLLDAGLLRDQGSSVKWLSGLLSIILAYIL